jgi:hypothetical protein
MLPLSIPPGAAAASFGWRSRCVPWPAVVPASKNDARAQSAPKFHAVIPAKAGIHLDPAVLAGERTSKWIPAFAGMTSGVFRGLARPYYAPGVLETIADEAEQSSRKQEGVTGQSSTKPNAVIPAKAGIHLDPAVLAGQRTSKWIPAFAGMTSGVFRGRARPCYARGVLETIADVAPETELSRASHHA